MSSDAPVAAENISPNSAQSSARAELLADSDKLTSAWRGFFRTADQDWSQGLSREEIQAYAARPNITTTQRAAADILIERFDDVAQMADGPMILPNPTNVDKLKANILGDREASNVVSLRDFTVMEYIRKPDKISADLKSLREGEIKDAKLKLLTGGLSYVVNEGLIFASGPFSEAVETLLEPSQEAARARIGSGIRDWQGQAQPSLLNEIEQRRAMLDSWKNHR